MSRWSLRALFLVENLDLPAATGVDDARWEAFQLAHLNDEGTFAIENKSRQIAWSFTAAAEALADAILSAIGSIFVSINLEEAKEKVRYAKACLEALPAGMRPKLARDHLLGLELENGARLLSLPSTPPRGKAKMNVYLDEFAHVRNDREIYTAALPVISRGGRLRIGSSPMGASGVFWEIFGEELRPYPGYRRRRTPWWEVFSFCLDVATARLEAAGMETAARVERFGNERIRAIYANMPLEDFQQEYECAAVDEATAWIPWSEIRAAQAAGADLAFFAGTGREKRLDAARAAIDGLAALVPTAGARSGKVEPVFTAGFDVGRTRNASELFVVGVTTGQRFPLRLAVTLERVAFEDQLEVLGYAMYRLPIVAMLVDRNGLGMHLAENMERLFPGRAAGVDFTLQSKLVWATTAKTLLQQGRAPLPVDREIAYQIHSIKRLVTPARNLVFDVERNERHHADKFWAWALALAAGAMALTPSPEGVVALGEDMEETERLEISPY